MALRHGRLPAPLVAFAGYMTTFAVLASRAAIHSPTPRLR
jgi:hypothetical protein